MDEYKKHMQLGKDVGINITYNNDAGGKPQWHIEVSGTAYWLESFDLLKDARSFCKKNGLTILSRQKKW